MNKHAQNLRAMLTLLPPAVDNVYRDKIYEAAVEIDRLDADATRYKWLRARNLDSIDKGGVFVGQTPHNVVINGEDMDRTIDLAMAGESA